MFLRLDCLLFVKGLTFCFLQFFKTKLEGAILRSAEAARTAMVDAAAAKAAAAARAAAAEQQSAAKKRRTSKGAVPQAAAGVAAPTAAEPAAKTRKRKKGTSATAARAASAPPATGNDALTPATRRKYRSVVDQRPLEPRDTGTMNAAENRFVVFFLKKNDENSNR